MKEKLEFVESVEDVEKNLRYLIQCRNSSSPKDVAFYESRMKMGFNFVVMIIDGLVEFGPSRFLGYKDIDRSDYEPKPHSDLHGGPTGQKLGKLFGRMQENAILENFFYAFFKKNIEGGHVPIRKYSFQFFLNEDKLKDLESFIPGIIAGGLQKPIDFDYEKVILRFKETLKIENNILRDFEVQEINNGWVWISDSYKVIGDKRAHYEIRDMNKSLWVVLHFEGIQAENDLFHQSIKTLPKGLVWTGWRGSKSICVKPEVVKNNDDFIQQLIDQLLFLEESIGDEVRGLIKKRDVVMESTNEPGDDLNTNTELNQILYGPPGTGKTYITVNKAIEIIEPSFDLSHPRDVVMDKYRSLVKSGNIMFSTFHQSLSYEDFIEGIKPETKNEQVTYDVQDGIFKVIAKRASENWNGGSAMTFTQAFNILKNKWESSENDEVRIDMVSKGSFFNIIGINATTIAFRKKSGSVKHTLSISTLNEIYEGNRTMSSGLVVYYNPLVRDLKEIAAKNSVETNEVKEQFVLIIDEINRGNVSSIFGELITLIEDDKRKGMPNELEVTLPYSKEKFSVPPNLHIIGTMNTADRSVEALDTALRRRFTFEEMMPLPELLEDKLGNKNDWNEIQISEVLKTINERITVLVDRDHQIGHSYFLGLKKSSDFDKDLKAVFTDKIIPLLQEYFFNDFVKIGMVLGKGFVVPFPNSKVKFAYIEDSVDTDYQDGNRYEIMSSNKIDLKMALDLLMRKGE
tara:strand:- start:79510 stop:81735 length:2226 start_codon:yes stop_codon:yes gene_type:complete